MGFVIRFRISSVAKGLLGFFVVSDSAKAEASPLHPSKDFLLFSLVLPKGRSASLRLLRLHFLIMPGHGLARANRAALQNSLVPTAPQFLIAVVGDAKAYQRLRPPPPPRSPPPPPPPPPRRRSPPPPPPPPPRGPVLARASSILIRRPFKSVSLRVWIAVAASAASTISTNPKPRDCPENLSVTTTALSTLPACPNSSARSS